MSEEVRVTAESGGQKGMKPERMGLIPWDAVKQIMTVPPPTGHWDDRLDLALSNLTAWWEAPKATPHTELLIGARATISLLTAARPHCKGFVALEWPSLRTIARTYHYGAEKYKDPVVGPYNWRRGYPWSLSFDSLIRHLASRVDGVICDDESGLNHLAHAGWHVLTLTWFSMHKPEFDDRPYTYFQKKEAA